MTAALDAAVEIAIYLAWAIVIFGGVLAIAAVASRWKIPKPLRPVPDAGEGEPEAPPTTTGSPDWNWPVRTPADAEVLFARRRLDRAIDNGQAIVGTAGSFVVGSTCGPEEYARRYGRPLPVRGPGSWDPEAFRGSLAEQASNEVWKRIEIEERTERSQP